MQNKSKVSFRVQFEKSRYTSGEKALTQEQVVNLLNSTNNLMEKTLLALAIAGGLRRSDIIAIKTRDVDIKNKELIFFENKKDRIKKIPIDTKVVNLLEMWMNINKSKWLFPSRFKDSKNHISSKTAYNILQRNCKVAGISTPRPIHTLRATCVKLCQVKGWSPSRTAKLIGDTVSVVEKHYATPSEEEMKKEMEDKPLL